ncbi:hypothetical protein FH608_011130 [Nonomuraea phyllanthi]|uniref:Uncharacterized protein n=1 Tax=Nonomuraea phyllanthi TaxID=2219224 RepID=A0A5C4WQZ0_9ACTN|nr:hypothetical protein [Nonomuraea phyllanthi]KAB8196012.1 hypothetical protein FH608_011130 [Nonomuraea phyllanthi]QFY07467.1 hypothetical protein GBF35_12930 [Nonomuraea phyllanthi]
MKETQGMNGTGKPASRRALIGGMLGGLGATVAASTVVGAVAGPALADGPAGHGGKAAPRPVAPVNQEIAARFGPEYKTLPAAAAGVDIEPLIAMHSADDIAARRAAMAGYIWKGAGLPTSLPTVEKGVDAPDFASLTGVRRIDRLTVPLRYQVSAKVYDIVPQRAWNRRLALYHNGHGEPFDTMLRTVQALLDRGYRVMAYAMPFHHWNQQQIADPKDPATLLPNPSHRELPPWESEEFSTLTFFLEPLTVTLNYAQATYRPKSVEMIGLSGGGWTTTVYSALDPRVTRSYPTAGSLPFFLRAASPKPSPTTGDFEQTKASFPGFYAAATAGTSDDFLDMYVLASVGRGRGQLQILNRFDECCFNGVSHRVYQAPVRDRVALLAGGRPDQGRWDLLEDATHDDHTISPYALSVILWDLDTTNVTT